MGRGRGRREVREKEEEEGKEDEGKIQGRTRNQSSVYLHHAEGFPGEMVGSVNTERQNVDECPVAVSKREGMRMGGRREEEGK